MILFSFPKKVFFVVLAISWWAVALVYAIKLKEEKLH